MSADSNDASVALAQQQPQPSAGRPDGFAKKVPSGLRVLVVDDDQLTRTLMSRVLTRLGCKVSTAENGEIALDMLLSSHGGHFAVVFLDNQMPVMSGLSMVAKLRGAGRNDFVVGVTGNALLSDQEEYLQAGVDRCAPSLFWLWNGSVLMLPIFFRVLTKPVLERSLRSMLARASERLIAGATENCGSSWSRMSVPL
jgi:osomolarity two-component system, sensor histidine kinase SLN1